jgi:hypothetical protein
MRYHDELHGAHTQSDYVKRIDTRKGKNFLFF